MAAISQILAHIYTMTLVFFTILILELVILVRSITHPCDRPITTKQYLKLINEKNPVSRFKGKPGSLKQDCAVCLSPFEEGDEVRKLKCNHIFHKDCLDTWLQQDLATCPLCRSKVLPEEIVLKFRQQRRNQLPAAEYEGSDEELIFLLSALHGKRSTRSNLSPEKMPEHANTNQNQNMFTDSRIRKKRTRIGNPESNLVSLYLDFSMFMYSTAISGLNFLFRNFV